MTKLDLEEIEDIELAADLRATFSTRITIPGLSIQIATLLRLMHDEKLSPLVVKQVVIGACWWTSNRLGRAEACKIKSDRAVSLIKAKGWVPSAFEHDHVVPRKEITKAILRLAGPAPDAKRVYALLRCSFECLVLREEHREIKPIDRMPKDWDRTNLWRRYEGGKIFNGDKFPPPPRGARFS